MTTANATKCPLLLNFCQQKGEENEENHSTVTDFYTQESDYVQQIKDYVKANGSYSNGKYILITDTSYSSGDTIQRAIVYSVSQDYIGLYVYMESSSGYYCGFMIQIESISTSYTWTMSDAYDYSMVGTIYS